MKIEQKITDLCNNIIPYFINTKFSRYIKDYKLYLNYKGDRAKEIESYQTNISVPFVSAIVDTMFASMYDSKLKFDLQDEEGDKGLLHLLNKFFDFENHGRDELLQSIKESIITGKGYVTPYLFTDIRKESSKGKLYKKVTKRPMIKYVSIFDVFYDYNTTLAKSSYRMYRSILTKQQIEERYISLMIPNNVKLDKEVLLNIKGKIEATLNKDPERFSEFNFNRVKDIISYEDLITNVGLNTFIPYINVFKGRDLNHKYSAVNNGIESHNNFYAVDFKSNQLHEVIEYRDNEHFVVMIDGHLLFNKKGYYKYSNNIYEISYGQIPGTSDSFGVATMLHDLQLMINTLENLYLDGLKMDIAPMYEQVGGLNQLLGEKNVLKYEPRKIIPTNTAGGLKKIDLGRPNLNPLQEIAGLKSLGEERVGINGYIMGTQQKVERVAGGIDMIYNQYKSKLMPLTNSIQQLMGRIAKEVLLMYAKYYTIEEVKKLGYEGELDIQRILDEDKLSFQLSSLAVLEKEEVINNIQNNLQAILQFNNTPEGQVLNGEEIIKGIITRDIDKDKIINKAKSKGRQSVEQSSKQSPLQQQASNLQFNK